MKTTKRASDTPQAKRVAAWVIMYNGEQAGRAIVAYPKDGAGRVYAEVWITAGPLSGHYHDGKGPLLGQAGGYGYCKTGTALGEALSQASPSPNKAFTNAITGGGKETVFDEMRRIGYTMLQAV